MPAGDGGVLGLPGPGAGFTGNHAQTWRNRLDTVQIIHPGRVVEHLVGNVIIADHRRHHLPGWLTVLIQHALTADLIVNRRQQCRHPVGTQVKQVALTA